MNAVLHQTQFAEANGDDDLDVIVVGAGISGIAMAVHLQRDCPDKRFAMLERRAGIGGTWDLFRYPGIRSDSDMYTMSLESEPWLEPDTLGQGHLIKGYLTDVAARHRLTQRIRFGTRVVSADWCSDEARWHVEIETEGGGERRKLRTRHLHLASGYYDYDEPYEAEIPGREDFAGTILHPQFWPENFDYAGKRVVVIGSGATAVTLVPAMAGTAAHVTMLQRSPTWIATISQRSKVIHALRTFLSPKLAHRAIRWLSIRFQRRMFREAREAPQATAERILKGVREALGDKFEAVHFTPDYAPWDQRLCFVPDNDLFVAMRAGQASVVTDRIARIDATGIALESGQHLDADVIVTATGLKLAVAGKIAVSVDGEPVDFAQRYYYNNAMFSNLPNLAVVFGYLNASWTLRSDIVAQYVCRVIGHMDKTGTTIATPVLGPDERIEDDNIFDFSSGYLQRSLHELPKSAKTLPWRLNQEYLHDRRNMRTAPIADGVLRFTTASPRERVEAPNEGLLEAAE